MLKYNMTKKNKCFFEIDIVKAFAAILVIVIHALSKYSSTSETYKILWDITHFGVGLFVFASGFLQANSTKLFKTWKEAGIALWQRYKRIVFPYYEYLMLYISAILITGKLEWFLDKLDLRFILETIFILDGVGQNWIPRLFMFISIIMLGTQFIKRLEKLKYKKGVKNILNQNIEVIFIQKVKEIAKNILPIFYVISFAWITYSLFKEVKVDFIYWHKFNNIFGWMVIYLTGFFLNKNYKWMNIFWIIIIYSALTIGSYFILHNLDASRTLFGNKYPPTLYFVGYNIVAIVAVLGIGKWLIDFYNIPNIIRSSISWLSKFSYEIFFYHLIFMYVVFKGIDLPFYTYFLLILFSTLALVWLISEFKKLIPRISARIHKFSLKK
jgi:hypothetical protein